MVKQSPRIYVYKITFEEIRHYYYGSHKERKFGEYYMGSPKTHKWMWEFYTPQIQILQVFEFSDKGYREAREIENRLIRPVFNIDPFCLNENCGGSMSLDVLRKVGQNSYKNGIGLFSMTLEERNEATKKGGKITGNKNKENGIGFCGFTFEQRSEVGKKSGNKNKENGIGFCGFTFEKRSEVGKKGGKIAGQKCKENGTGIFSMTIEQRHEANKKGAQTINSQKYQCTVTRFISTSGPLTIYQRKRGIDPSNRLRIQ